MKGHPHAKTPALAVEFLNDWEAVFAVLENLAWPLTNNEAECALRQISHGTRTPRGSRYFALLASVIDTCRRRQGLPLLPLPI